MPVPHDQLAGTFMDSIAATLQGNGTLSVNMFGEVVEDVWTDNGDDTGKDCTASIEDGLLVLRAPDSVTRYEKIGLLGTTGYLF